MFKRVSPDTFLSCGYFQKVRGVDSTYLLCKRVLQSCVATSLPCLLRTNNELTLFAYKLAISSSCRERVVIVRCQNPDPDMSSTGSIVATLLDSVVNKSNMICMSILSFQVIMLSELVQVHIS